MHDMLGWRCKQRTYAKGPEPGRGRGAGANAMQAKLSWLAGHTKKKCTSAIRSGGASALWNRCRFCRNHHGERSEINGGRRRGEETRRARRGPVSPAMPVRGAETREKKHVRVAAPRQARHVRRLDCGGSEGLDPSY